MSTLPRINAEKYNDPMMVERQKLLADAAAQLNYRPAMKNSLLCRLLAIDVVPLRTKAVEEYMASKEKKGIYSGTVKFWIWLVATFVALVSGASLLASHHEPSNFTGVGFGLVMASLISFLVVTAVGRDLLHHGRRTVTTWSYDRLPNYEGTIPDHVLNVAMQIHTAIPDAYFTIHRLGHMRETRIPDPDPFLKVNLQSTNESYYVEQWQEKELPRIEE